MPNTDQLEGLSAIAEALGVSVQTARRRINSDLWPEVHKVEGRYGDTWIVDVPGLSSIAEREGSEIDLREDQVTPKPIAHDELRALMAGYKASVVESAEASAMVGVAEAERDRQVELSKRLNKDLEQERAEMTRLSDQLTTIQKDLAVASARAEERQALVEAQQVELVEMKQALSDSLAATKDHQAQTQAAESSLGWLARRRYQRKNW